MKQKKSPRRVALGPRSLGNKGLPAALATQVIGNRKSLVYHRATCANAVRMTATNRVTFASEKEAAAAGYRPGKDCFK